MTKSHLRRSADKAGPLARSVSVFVALLAAAPIATAEPDPTVEWVIEHEGMTICSAFGDEVDGTDLHPVAIYIRDAHPVRELTREQIAEAELGSIERFCPQLYAPFVDLVTKLRVTSFEYLWDS